MKGLSKAFGCLFVCLTLGVGVSSADNQTVGVSPISPASGLPFRIVIEQAGFKLPVGLHSGVVGRYKGLWVFVAGRMNGLHGFGGDPFPADLQNTSIYVVDPATGSVNSRLLSDPSSGLNQQQIDTLSVTSPQGYQDNETLYITGGYGIDTNSHTFATKPVLTALYVPGIVQWVMGNPNSSVAGNMRQMYNPIFQVTGGRMFKSGNMTQLVFGQNFTGVYTPGSNGDYSQQIRRFQIKSADGQLGVDILGSTPSIPDPNYRRRDLNVIPTLQNINNVLQYGLVAYSGVFTLTGGVWTVPVVIDSTGNPMMADPSLSATFKQGMNNYVSAAVGLFSRKSTNMYHIFFGGLSYGYYDTNNVFQTDNEIPFINQVTAVKIDKTGSFTQYLMGSQYPVILSTEANPGNQLLFGAGAYFIANNISQYANGVINLDNIRQPTVLGYIVGGIQSTLANTNTQSDSAASPYVFKVTLVPTG
jgi:hypothetical protein